PTAASGAEALAGVRDRGVQLVVAPGLANRRHLPAALAQQDRQRLRVGKHRALGDRRPDVPLAGEAVALRADAVERLAREHLRLREPLSYPGVVLAGGKHLDTHRHRRVLDAAELRALAAEAAELEGAERGAVDLAGNRVELAAKRRDPPAVGDIGGADLELDLA